MHEITLAKTIIDSIEDKDKLKSIEIEIGELAGITADELKETLEKLTSWGIKINEIPSIIKCTCGYIGRANIRQRLHDLVIYNCPKCGAVPKPTQGDKIKIKKIIYK